MNYLENLKKPFFVLAPMDDVTDTVFRRLVAELAPADLYFTEFVNVDGLQSPGRTKLLKKLRFAEPEQTLTAQLWGKDPKNFETTAQEIANGSLAKEMGLPKGTNFIGVDLNMGCPQKHEVNIGTCSALINDRPKAEEIIAATRRGLNGKLPLSVKTRTGFNEVDLTWIEFLLNHKLNMLTIHGRTRKQMSKVPADWEVIGKARELRDKISPDTLIVGNGDVVNRVHGQELAGKYGLDGIMIGRGIFQDPYAFSEISLWENISAKERIELYKKHVSLFRQTWQNNERPVHVLNKFCKIYINGFEGAKEMRERLMSAQSPQELYDLISSTRSVQAASLSSKS